MFESSPYCSGYVTHVVQGRQKRRAAHGRSTLAFAFHNAAALNLGRFEQTDAPLNSVSSSVNRGLAWLDDAHRVALWSYQNRIVDTLRRAMGNKRECALIDFPDHPNVGDSLIWLGELRALEQLGVRIRYVCAEHNYDPNALRARLTDDTVILIHGGGNFGTLYARHQRLRERVLADFPGHTTVQLSQSIDFEPGEVLERMQRIVAAHRAFKILVRDERSLQFAAGHFDCPTELCPDFALMLGSQRTTREPRTDVFILARTDKEKSADWSEVLASRDRSGWLATDWLTASFAEDRLSKGARLARSAARKALGAKAHTDLFSSLWQRTYRTLSDMRMQRGIDLLTQGRVVLTDRLHAHVLCVLLGQPHVVLGDSQGKIRAFYQTFSHRLSPAPWADSPAEAFAAADAMLATPLLRSSVRASA